MIKSYYFKRDKIVIRDYSGKKMVLALIPCNLEYMIDDLTEQIEAPLDKLMENEESLYKKYINIMLISTMAEVFLTFIVMYSFMHASYIGVYGGICLSLLLVLFTSIISGICIHNIRKASNRYRIYEGREILIKKCDSLNRKSNLVDVY